MKLAGATLMWCSGCDRIVTKAQLDQAGQHCGEEPYSEEPRGIFKRMALAAIPQDLISTPAVAAGDARRLKLAAALWPSIEALFEALSASAPVHDCADDRADLRKQVDELWAAVRQISDDIGP